MEALEDVAEKIQVLGESHPQLKQFSSELHLDGKSLKIVYEFNTHVATHRGGWTSGVPNPSSDGIWFYIDFHDPSSLAQIHTQPLKRQSPYYLGDKELQFLILEGTETKSVTDELWAILKSTGIEQHTHSEPVGSLNEFR